MFEENDAALKIFLQLIKHYPEYVCTYQCISQIYFKQENWKEALNYIEKYITFKPEVQPQLAYYVARIHVKMSNYQKALGLYIVFEEVCKEEHKAIMKKEIERMKGLVEMRSGHG